MHEHNDDNDNDGYLISHFVNIPLINGRLVKFIRLKIYAFIVWRCCTPMPDAWHPYSSKTLIFTVSDDDKRLFGLSK